MQEDIIHITDVIEPGMLRKIESSFSGMFGIAAWISDSNGVGVTDGSGFAEYPSLCLKSEAGRQECARCIAYGASVPAVNGRAVRTECFGGLAVYSAPILIGDKTVGILSGGWVPTDVMNYSDIEKTAKTTGESPERLAGAAAEMRILPPDEADRAAAYVREFAGLLSDMAQKMDQIKNSSSEAVNRAEHQADFVTNVSHEMRTPLNAILGMSEMALRAEDPKDAREYLHQIRSSGRHLLTIINDIMDYSKIEAGDMAIVEVKYEPLSLVNDVAGIVNSMLGNRSIDFTVDLSANMPKQLVGDNVRIQQILINLLGNAVKFTRMGNIGLKLQAVPSGKDEVLLCAEISDTGCGIQPDEMDALFTRMKQMDIRRNVSGTGLGLAISKRLLNLMNGSITARSEFGKGSVFSFQLPQKCSGGTYLDDVHADGQQAWVYVRSSYVSRQIGKDLTAVGMKYMQISDINSCGEKGYLIVGREYVTEALKQFVRSHRELMCVLLDRFDSTDKIDIPNITILRCPEYSINLYSAMGICRSFERSDSLSDEEASFTAPEARILIVDDNDINLEVAKGVTEPLGMQVDTAASAEEAIEKVRNCRYDIVFMDHMMPGMDGIEATHLIREKFPTYADVPIIALTASVGSGAREMFLREGMNDFIAKPIDIRDMINKIRRWLSEEKIVPVSMPGQSTAPTASSMLPVVEGVDTAAALSLLNSENLLRIVMKQFCRSAERNESHIRYLWKISDIKQFTIEVHSLKSSARQIGANHLSQMAALLEEAGNKYDVDFINRHTNAMLTEYLRISQALSSYFNDTEAEMASYSEHGASSQRPASGGVGSVSVSGASVTANVSAAAPAEQGMSLLDEMQQAIDEMDTIHIDDVIEKMEAFNYSGAEQQFFERLKVAADDCDIDAAAEIIAEWKKQVQVTSKNLV